MARKATGLLYDPYQILRQYEKQEYKAPQQIKPIRSKRVCLICLSSFDSDWAGNRMCLYCKKNNAYRGI